MSTCTKCSKEIPDAARFCPWCGQKDPLTPPRQNVKHRGNGTGSVYQLKNKSWAAVRVVGYKVGPDGRRHKQTVGKYGFRTKREAMNALATLTKAETQKKSMTFQQLYDKWEPTHKASKSTMNCYHAAMNWFRPLWLMQISDIDIDDLQECVSECPKGKRTRENMKALCGLLYKYAIPRHLATLNMGQYLVVGGGSSGEKDALPMDAVDALAGRIGSIPFADYIVAQCYLGFRPSELLALTVDSYDREGRYFTGGAKTDAGRDRIVTVSPKIQPIIDRLIDKRTSGPVFPDKGGGHMSISAYCGKNGFTQRNMITVNQGSKTTATITKINKTALKQNMNCKVKVEALKGSTVIGTSRINHMGGLNQTKYTNAKSIKLNKTAVTLKAKNTFTLKPTVTKENSKKPLIPTSHGAYYRYATSDSAVATVDSSGKITAKAPGTCIVYVAAQNGRTAQITVTVK